jgi:hypothetical protein
MKQLTIKSLFLLLALSSAFSACKVDDDPNPHPDVPSQISPLPDFAKLKLLKRSETDFQEFNYNASGFLNQGTYQWQFVQNDPSALRKIVYDFKVDANGRPTEMSYLPGYRIEYVYQNGLIVHSKEFSPGGALNKDRQYQYQQKRISRVVEVRANVPPAVGTTTYRFDYSYDQRGNLNKTQESILSNPNTPQEKASLVLVIEYLDFDDQINPNSWQLVYPFLPHLRWQFNNPRKEVRYEGELRPIKTTLYRYQYNDQKLPVLRTEELEGGPLSTQYFYR